MSLLRYFIRQNRPRHFYDHHFSLTPFADEAFKDFMAPMVLREPWHYFDSTIKDIDSTVKADENKLQINLDLKNFAQNEITVKTKDRQIIVEGKHEEREDEHSYMTRHFVRSYALPEDCKAESVESRLSEDGVLTVTAPRSSQTINNERIVPITHKAEQSEDGVSKDSVEK